MISLVLSSFPIHLTNILIFYQLHCSQTASSFSQIKSFKKVNDCASWFRAVFHNQELKDLSPSIKRLEFQCTINILRIESEENILFEYPLDIDLKKKRQFICDWKIKDDMLDKFKTAKHGKFLSDNYIHSNMWSLQLAPNGYRMNDHGSVRLFMQLCALPNGIKSIRLTRKFMCLDKGIERANTKDQPWGYDFDKSMRQNSGWGKAALKRSDINDLDEINFRVIITITGYTTNDGKTVNLPEYVEEKKVEEKKKEDTKKATTASPSTKRGGKKRKRSSSPAKKKKDDDKKDDDDKDDDEDKDKPPKKKRKTVTKKKDKNKKKDKDKKGKKKKKNSGKEEASDDDGDNVDDEEDEEESDSDDDWKMNDVKKLEIDNKIHGICEWQLSNDLLLQFKNAKYRKVWKSQEFIVNDLKWCIEVYPAGHNKSDKDSGSFMMFLTMLTKLSDDIGKMSVYWRLYIKPCGLSYSSISEFTQKNNSFGLCGGILTKKELSTFKNTFSKKVTLGCELTILNKIDTKDLKTKIYKQIYPLKIKNDDDGISGENNQCFNKKCKFEWKIDGDLMKKFKNAPNGKSFESSTFNANMWSLRCCPNGETDKDEGKCDLILQLNSFPKGIGKIKVLFKLKCVETGSRALLVHNYNITKSAAGWIDKLNFNDIKGLNSITFKVFIDIQMFYDTKNKRIKSL